MANDEMEPQDGDRSASSGAEADAIVSKAAATLDVAQRLVQREYLSELDAYSVAALPAELVLDTQRDVRLFRLSRLVQESREAALESAVAAYAALGSKGITTLLILQSDGANTDLYLGAISRRRGASAGDLLTEVIGGHFPGSELECLKSKSIEAVRAAISPQSGSRTKALCAVTSIPTLSIEEREHFVQGIERFIEAGQGRCYTAIILADPVSQQDLRLAQAGYESIATQLAPLLKTQMSYGIQESETVGLSICEGISKSLGSSLALTETTGKSTSFTTSRSRTESRTKDPAGLVGVVGSAGGALIGNALLPGFGAIAGAFVGSKLSAVSSALVGSKTTGSSESESLGETSTSSSGVTSSSSETTTQSSSETSSNSQTVGSSRQVTLDLPNKAIDQLLKRIDSHLERLDEARAFGGWQSAAYIVADTTEASQALGSIFLGLMRGSESGAEDFALTTWNKDSKDNRDRALEWVYNMSHPQLVPPFAEIAEISHVTPATLLTGREVGILLGLPRHSTSAVTVLEAPSYGRKVRLLALDNGEPGASKRVGLGRIRHLWKTTTEELGLNFDKFCYHTLVTGTTGVGKTTAIQHILRQLHEAGVPFLVVEPAKGEYRCLTGLETPGHPVHYRVAGRNDDCSLRMNPLVFPVGIQLSDHIDRVCTVMNAAFPMYAAMPQVLEEAVFTAYEELGWDSITSLCVSDGRRFPTLKRVADLIPEVVKRLGYSEQLSSDYIGALSTRLRSFCRGSLGMTLLCSESEETSGEILFESSCVVDLSPLGSPDKRALIMGMLFMRLYERRMAEGLPSDNQGSLHHLMVLEEAHNLLKRTSTQQSQEGSNPRGLAVESFANAMAEMRAYGQGFLIADQSASALDDCILRNTSTKIVMRAPFEEDRIALGGALALSEDQENQLARLENWTAVVHQSHWLEPVLCQIVIKGPILAKVKESRKEDGVEVREARTRLLLTALAKRLRYGSLSPVFDSNFETDPDLDTLGISGEARKKFLELRSEEEIPELRTLAPILCLLFPQLRDSAFTSLDLSAAAQWNRILALLQEHTTLTATDVNRLAIASDILKCLPGANTPEITEQHLEVERRQFGQ